MLLTFSGNQIMNDASYVVLFAEVYFRYFGHFVIQ